MTAQTDEGFFWYFSTFHRLVHSYKMLIVYVSAQHYKLSSPILTGNTVLNLIVIKKPRLYE